MALSFEMSEALSFSEIYSKHGLEEMVKDAELMISVKQSDLKKVEAGELWNPLMKEFNMKELTEDIQKLQTNILVYKAAIRIKEFKEKHGHTPTVVEIDGMEVIIDNS